MMKHLFHHIVATVFLFSAAVTYEKTFVQWITPAEVEAFPIRPARQVRGPAHLDDLFVEGSWQRGSCKSLTTNEMTLLYQNWEQTSSDQLRVWPVTVITGRGLSPSPEDEPIVIESERGATIKFTKPLEALSGKAPPIQRGQLLGDVHLYRQASGGQSIDMMTSNIAIDHRRIWTTDTIDLRVGQARIVGRDLTFYLGGNPMNTSGDAKSSLDRMELIYLDDLFMPLSPSTDPNTITTAQPSLAIRCAGRLEYDFSIHQLKMRDTVSLVHQDGLGEINQFDCDSIELSLIDPMNQTLPRNGPLDWIRSVVAEGSPAVATLGSYDSELVAETIQFDAGAGRVQAQGSQGIRLRYGAFEASLANLTYVFDPSIPDAIGLIDIDGVGIVDNNDPQNPLRKLQWERGLSLRPDPNSHADPRLRDMLVFLDQGIEAWLVDGGQFSADDIQGRIKVLPGPSPLRHSPNRSQQSGHSAAHSQRSQLVWSPDYFDILGNVRIDTAAINAETNHMHLFFADDFPVGHAIGGNTNTFSSAGGSSPSTASPLRQWVSQPTPAGDGVMTAPVARPRPKVIGDKITAQLKQGPKGLTAKQLKVAGNVQVTHTLETGGRSLPTTLTGELLQLVDQGGEDVLQLGSGPNSPARFDIGDGFFIGPEIQIRPTQNLIWIKDAGEFQFPSQAIPSGLGGEDGGSKITWIRPPHCRWRGHMLFDGTQIELTGGVDISGALVNSDQPWDFTMNGDRLEVDLWENIDLKDFSQSKDANIRSITLLESQHRPVFVQAIERTPTGVLQAKHLLNAKSLTLIPAKQSTAANVSGQRTVAFTSTSPSTGSIAGGNIVGQGPGWYRAWMPDEDEENLEDEPSTRMVATGELPLTGIHLTYNDEMSVDLGARSLLFQRGVRVGKRPVTDWEAIFDAQTMSVLKTNESTLDCDQLHVAMEPQTRIRRARTKQPIAWEMKAIGGVVFRTRSEKGLIEGTASMSSYSSSKDIFTATGNPGRPATIRRRLPDGTPQLETAIPSIAIRLKTLAIEAQLGSIGLTPPSSLVRPQTR